MFEQIMAMRQVIGYDLEPEVAFATIHICRPHVLYGALCSFIPYYFALEGFAGLQRFRIVQVEPVRFDILLVADKDYFDGIKTQVMGRLQCLCRTRTEYRLRRVVEIPRDPGGKLCILVSNVGRSGNVMQSLFKVSLKGYSGSSVQAPMRRSFEFMEVLFQIQTVNLHQFFQLPK